MIGHKTSSHYVLIEFIQSMCSIQTHTKLKKFEKSPNIWKLINMCLNDPWVKEKKSCGKL